MQIQPFHSLLIYTNQARFHHFCWMVQGDESSLKQAQCRDHFRKVSQIGDPTWYPWLRIHTLTSKHFVDHRVWTGCKKENEWKWSQWFIILLRPVINSWSSSSSSSSSTITTGVCVFFSFYLFFLSKFDVFSSSCMAREVHIERLRPLDPPSRDSDGERFETRKSWFWWCFWAGLCWYPPWILT